MNTENNITIYYSPTYTHSGASFDTHLKANLVANKIERLQNDRLRVVAPSPATVDELNTVHSAQYVTEMFRLPLCSQAVTLGY